MLRVIREESRRRHLEHFTSDAHAIPLGELNPGLGFQLRLSVGGDNADRVLEGGHGPQDEPANKGGLPDAVAGGAGETNGALDRSKASAKVQ